MSDTLKVTYTVNIELPEHFNMARLKNLEETVRHTVRGEVQRVVDAMVFGKDPPDMRFRSVILTTDSVEAKYPNASAHHDLASNGL